MIKIFLGGTCNGSTWRNDLIKLLKIDYFNPVVADWTEECQAEELRQRETCDYCLYVITPKMTGVYSIAEAVDDSHERPKKTIFCFLATDTEKVVEDLRAPVYKKQLSFTHAQIKSLTAVGGMVLRNGGQFFKSLKEVANFVNKEN